MALVLSRKVGQEILIEGDIVLAVLSLDAATETVSLSMARLNGEQLSDTLVINKNEKLIILQTLRVQPLTIGRINVRLAFETLPGCEQLDVYRAELINASHIEDDLLTTIEEQTEEF